MASIGTTNRAGAVDSGRGTDKKEENNMWTKNILKAFNPETEIKYIINGKLIENITTVKEFIENGLTTYSTVTEGQLDIRDNCIIIRASV